MKHTLRFEKTWQEETKSSVPRMVGNLVYGVSPVSAALSVRRREFYALLGDKTLDLSSIHRTKESRKSFEKVIKLSEKLNLMEHEQEGYGLTRSLRASSRRDIFVVGKIKKSASGMFITDEKLCNACA
ncbi:unnamed protein product [Brassica rapa subsp. trilocularis]